MLSLILRFGVAAGAIAIVPMSLMLTFAGHSSAASSYFTGYLIMILALSLVFVAIKKYRDRALGGVIRFLPAFLIGLGISAVAGLIYTIGWEITLAATDFSFVDEYSRAAIEGARGRGASAAEIAAVTASMADFRTQYANPAIRLPMTFVEIFPVGLLVSLISAALLRNSRILPARTLSR